MLHDNSSKSKYLDMENHAEYVSIVLLKSAFLKTKWLLLS